jgi:hypothetical protein
MTVALMEVVLWPSFRVVTCFLQLQMEKEKQNYDFENIQSQLDKALGQATRLQKERETVQLESDRIRDKYEKVQVG